MREIPILFSAPMVQAILAGRKTQTRRVIKLPSWSISDWQHFETNGKTAKTICEKTGCEADIQCPYGKPGDILWVRETWQLLPSGFDEIPPEYNYIYAASHQLSDECTRWRPSIHMPRAACRLFLRVKNVRVERLQDISEEDAKAEGITSYWAEPHKDVAPFIGAVKEIGADLCSTRREAFEQLWDSIYAAPQPVKIGGIVTHYESYPWADIQETRDYKGKLWIVWGNPWVWPIDFERVHNYTGG